MYLLLQTEPDDLPTGVLVVSVQVVSLLMGRVLPGSGVEGPGLEVLELEVLELEIPDLEVEAPGPLDPGWYSAGHSLPAGREHFRCSKNLIQSVISHTPDNPTLH